MCSVFEFQISAITLLLKLAKEKDELMLLIIIEVVLEVSKCDFTTQGHKVEVVYTRAHSIV